MQNCKKSSNNRNWFLNKTSKKKKLKLNSIFETSTFECQFIWVLKTLSKNAFMKILKFYIYDTVFVLMGFKNVLDDIFYDEMWG